LGGREALGKLTSRKSTGTVTLTTPGGPVSGTVEILLKTPNKSHLQMTLDLSAMGAGKMTIEQAFDGTAGYSINSMQGQTEIPAKQIDNLRNNVFPTPLLAYKDRGTRIEVLPNEKISDKDAIALLVTPKAGSPARMFLDAETYLLIRLVTTITAPQLRRHRANDRSLRLPAGERRQGPVPGGDRECRPDGEHRAGHGRAQRGDR
jgi:hypothetical protein